MRKLPLSYVAARSPATRARLPALAHVRTRPLPALAARHVNSQHEARPLPVAARPKCIPGQKVPDRRCIRAFARQACQVRHSGDVGVTRDIEEPGRLDQPGFRVARFGTPRHDHSPMDAALTTLDPAAAPRPAFDWFATPEDASTAAALGFRFAPGGVHLSKTMMLSELTAVFDATPALEPAAIEQAILVDNVLAKRTGTARRLALAHLNTLYGIVRPRPVQSVLLRLWPRNAIGRPLLVLLCSLAREPMLRATAGAVLPVPVGTAVRWSDLGAALDPRLRDRYSPKTLAALAQRCASSWTQSGHLRGRVNKRRRLAEPSPETTAYAALLGAIAGFGGPALLRSPWMRVLDRSEWELLNLLRRAESMGLARVKVGGGVIQIEVRQPMAEMLEVPEIADGR